MVFRIFLVSVGEGLMTGTVFLVFGMLCFLEFAPLHFVL